MDQEFEERIKIMAAQQLGQIFRERIFPQGTIVRLRDNLEAEDLVQGFKPGEIVFVEEVKSAVGTNWILVRRLHKNEWGHFQPNRLRHLRSLELLALMADL